MLANAVLKRLIFRRRSGSDTSIGLVSRETARSQMTFKSLSS